MVTDQNAVGHAEPVLRVHFPTVVFEAILLMGVLALPHSASATPAVHYHLLRWLRTDVHRHGHVCQHVHGGLCGELKSNITSPALGSYR